MLVWNEFLNDARVLKEAQTLQGVGYQVTVFALHTPNKTQEKEILASGVKVLRVARSPFWKLRGKHKKHVDNTKHVVTPVKVKSLATHRQILRLIARLSTHAGLCYQMVKSKPDAIHAHDVNVLPTAWFASKICRVPLVYDAHEISTSREGYQSFRNVVGWVEKKLMPKAVATITTTDMRAKFFARAYGIKRPIVLQNRPCLPESSALKTDSNRLRKELELKYDDWPIIVYQGGLQQGRGLPKLVECAPNVPNAYFVFIGGGRQTTELMQLAEQLCVTDRVKFIPTVALAELPEYTASADIGVQPIENTCLNHFSTDSNKLFEYILAELPVVATNFPEIRKVVQQYQVGEVVPDNDLNALVAVLNKLVCSPELREVYKGNAVKAAPHLCWQEQEHKLVELYRQVLNK